MNKRGLAFFSIVVAGETIFMLPFVIPRLYRPLMLEGWGLTNTDFGVAFSAYGILAMLSYLFGGPFADKFHPRVLIAASLVITAFGSVYLAFFPSASSLIFTYGFFGVSTILVLWGALIKTTHITGGESKRSFAMGLLDSGRGLVAAAFSSLLVYVVALAVPDLKSLSQQARALEIIYLVAVVFTLLVAGLVWIGLRDFQEMREDKGRWHLREALDSLKNPHVWLLSLVVLGAYSGYKGIDNYSIYMVDVHNVDLAQASVYSSIIFWLRPVAALLAGVIADGLHKSRSAGRFLVLLALLSIGGIFQLLLAFAGLSSFYYGFALILFASAFAYALRAVYFSVFGDLKIPRHLIGTTTGIVSFVGFLPDAFFGLVTGHLIDTHPGALGFQYAFIFTGLCLGIGAIASFWLYRKSRS